MILSYANILCLEHEPLSMASRVSSADALHHLRSIQVQASREVDGEWERAAPAGTGFRQLEPEVTARGIYASMDPLRGVSMGIAPRAGIGFWHDLPTFGVARLRDALSDDIADERALVILTVEHFGDPRGPAVVAVTDVISEWRTTFVSAYRARIAYALAYHASLRRQSLVCHDSWYETVIRGTVAQAGAVAREDDELDQFSLVLNLLARLDGAHAYERHHGVPSPQAPGAVLFYADKVFVLQARLAALSRPLVRRFNADGRAALRLLLAQLRWERRENIWNVDHSPDWGQHTPALWDGRWSPPWAWR